MGGPLQQGNRRVKNWVGRALAAPVTIWLLVAFAAPLLVVVLLSLQPVSDPFAPLFTSLNGAQFKELFSDPFYLSVLLKTSVLAMAVCGVTILLGYPMALWIVSLPPRRRPLAMSIVLVPLLVNVVVRSLGVELLLAPDGLVNSCLKAIGLPSNSHMLYTYGAISVGLVQAFLPFMILSLYDVLQATPPRIMEAAQSLGASRTTRFFTIELPLSLPGLRDGATIVFLMASSTYVSARMLGGKKAWTTGMLVWQEVLENLNGQFASALAVVTTLICLVASVLIVLAISRLTPWLSLRPARVWSIPRVVVAMLDAVLQPLACVLVVVAVALLLLPLVLVFVQSFNNVPQATMAGFRGFTFQWYAQLFRNQLYFDSFWISLKLAVTASFIAVLLATAAAFTSVRGRFAEKPILEAFWIFPIALPQIAIGIGMLRLLRAFETLPVFLGLLAVHVTVTLPYCIGLLRTSVLQLDRTLEEAASGLGANSLRRFAHIVLPDLAPGLATAAIVATLLSFEEVTVTSFLTTARTITLPVRIYAEASYSLTPTVFAISTLMIAMTVSALFVLGRLVRLDRVFSR
jgi:putative spermidine/putrescine transport system permease protein